MSILNAWVEPKRALIACDTSANGRDGGTVELSKMMPLVHLNAMLAVRGYAAFFLFLCTNCWLPPGDFDALMDAMPTLLRGAFEQFKKAAAEAQVTSDYDMDSQHVILVGWSPRAARVVGYAFAQYNVREGFVSSEIDPSYIGPWDQDLIAHHPRPSTVSAMEGLARTQIRLYEEKAPHARTGGRLVVAELFAGGMRIARACELG